MIIYYAAMMPMPHMPSLLFALFLLTYGATMLALLADEVAAPIAVTLRCARAMPLRLILIRLYVMIFRHAAAAMMLPLFTLMPLFRR